jgi:LPS export ABC transporter protein LptC
MKGQQPVSEINLKPFNKILSIFRRIAVLLTGTAIVLSCDNDLEVATNVEVLKLPSLTVKNFRSEQTDSGFLQVIIQAPLVERYTRDVEPYSEFPKGIEVTFFNRMNEPSAHLSSDYAKYFEGKKMWELRYNVKVRNEQNELLETELLFWEEEKDRVYTDRYVRITRKDMIANGIGFESDSRLTKTRILKGHNTSIYVDDEQ